MHAQPTETGRGRAMATTTPAQQDPVDAAPAAQADSDDHREQCVRRAAYALFEARGCGYGHELEDWLKAEAEVEAQRQQGFADPSSAAVSAPARPPMA